MAEAMLKACALAIPFLEFDYVKTFGNRDGTCHAAAPEKGFLVVSQPTKKINPNGHFYDFFLTEEGCILSWEWYPSGESYEEKWNRKRVDVAWRLDSDQFITGLVKELQKQIDRKTLHREPVDDLEKTLEALRLLNG